MTRTTGVIFSPVLGRTFFLPGFGASSLTEDEDDFNEELDVDVEFDVEPVSYTHLISSLHLF